MTEPTAKRAPTQYTTVTMDDGRKVEFAGKRKLIKESTIADNGDITVRLDFVSGEVRVFKLAADAALFSQFAAHGAEQKLGDEIAGLDEVDDCVMAVDELMDRLAKGEWGVKREANGMAGSSVLAKALVAVTGKSITDIKAFLGTKSHAEKTALRNNPKVLAEVQKIEAAKSKGKDKPAVDTDAMLGELKG